SAVGRLQARGRTVEGCLRRSRPVRRQTHAEVDLEYVTGVDVLDRPLDTCDVSSIGGLRVEAGGESRRCRRRRPRKPCRQLQVALVERFRPLLCPQRLEPPTTLGGVVTEDAVVEGEVEVAAAGQLTAWRAHPFQAAAELV